MTKQYFNKRLIMTGEDEEIYNNPHICWIYKQGLNMDRVFIVMLLVDLETLLLINVTCNKFKISKKTTNYFS